VLVALRQMSISSAVSCQEKVTFGHEDGDVSIVLSQHD